MIQISKEFSYLFRGYMYSVFRLILDYDQCIKTNWHKRVREGENMEINKTKFNTLFSVLLVCHNT